MSVLKGDYSIDDFDEADFLNPISLLAALQKLSLREVENAQGESSCDFLTVADIQRQYGLSEDYIRSALLAGSLSPSKMILYFSKSDVEDLVANMSDAAEANPLTEAFERELDKMVMNYSYKPLLLLALFSKEKRSGQTGGNCTSITKVLVLFIRRNNIIIPITYKPSRVSSLYEFSPACLSFNLLTYKCVSKLLISRKT